jgi:zinc/manganese transport system permease protein
MSDLWHYAFVQQALAAGAITALVAGCIGPFVVLRNMSFAVHGLAEVGFTGAAGAVVLGFSPELGLLAATFMAAALFGALGVRLRERDIAIGSVLAFGIGLGVLFLSLYTRYATEAFSILFGSILAVSRDDVIRTASVGFVVLVAMAWIWRPLRFASIDPEVAEARGVPVRLLSTLFLLIMALAVAVTVQVVGVLLILTLLITPGAAAQRLTLHPTRITIYATLISLGATLGGITLAVYTSQPVSFFVSAISLGIYLVSRWLGPVQLGTQGRRAASGETQAATATVPSSPRA